MKNMKEWQKVLFGIVTMFVLLFAVDRIVGAMNNQMYYNSKYGIFRRQIYCLHESKDDILILGSSRAAHHYVPQVFQDSLGMTCFNAGSDGMCVYYHYAMLASRISRGVRPKMVVFDVLASDAEKSNGATFSLDAALDRLAPHYGEIPEIDSLFYLEGWKERVKLCSMMYCYNSKLVQEIKCNFIPWPEDRGYEALKGKMKLTDGMASDVLTVSSDIAVIEDRKLEYVRRIIKLCKENNIKLFLCYSPYYQQAIPLGVTRIKALAKENDILFLDYGLDERFQNNEYFQDASHLNDDGAHAYSKEIVKCL